MRPARAQFNYTLGAGTSVGVSDNPASQSGTTSPKTAAFGTVRGNVNLGYAGRLSTERMGYGIAATSWTGNAQRSSITHTLDLASEIQAGPAVKLAFTAGGTLAQLSLLDSVASTDPQTVGPRPAGDQKFLTANVGETLSWMMTGAWSLDQGLAGRIYRPLGDNTVGTTRNKSASFDLGVSRAWQRDTGGVHGVLGVMSAAGTPTGQTTEVTSNSDYGQAELTWRRDWSAEITHNLAAGVFFVKTDKVHVLPSGLASIAWRRLGNEVELRASRSATTSIYVGTAYVRSIVSLNASVPLDRWERLRFVAGGDVEHASNVGGTDSVSGSANVYSARAGLTWRPGNMFTYGLDYNFRDQRASAGSTTISSFKRQTIMLTVDVQYPPVP
jgi:hypothetical protein